MAELRKGIAVKEIIDQANLSISIVHNEKWSNNQILHPRAQRPGLALTGYLKYLNKQRIQILGKTEIGYLDQLNQEDREKSVKKYLSTRVPGILISEDLKISDFLIATANRYRTPILISKLKTALLMARISSALYQYFSKKVKIHGVMMEIMGHGILITGDSGIGKSETALDFVNKGYHLIADDLIEFYLNSYEEPVGRSADRNKNWLEVRGLGIINIIDIFGESAILDEKKLDLVINLEKWNPKKKYDRLGEDNLLYNIFEKELPLFNLPVAPGRNLSTLIEVAVRYYISRKKGKQSFLEHHYGGEND